MIQSYYHLLGVGEDASDAELRKAYRQKAQELHPDINPSESAHQRFIELTEAYQYLLHYRKQPNKQSLSKEEAIRQAMRQRARRYAEMRYHEFKKNAEALEQTSIHDIFFGKWVTALLGLVALFFLIDSVWPAQKQIESLNNYQRFCNTGEHCRGLAETASFRFETDMLFSTLWHKQPVVFHVTPLRKEIKYYYLIDYPIAVFKPSYRLSDYFFLPALLLFTCLLALFYPFRRFSSKLYLKTLILFCSFLYGILFIFFSFGT
ncbi:MAG: DnaJ domain-containing protein [Flavobacteriales bacterium]|nr:DnaJ domain-containing protein [Flavobacteriales bacterium]